MDIEHAQRQPIIKSETGNRIKAFQTKKDVPLEQMAEQTGLTKSYLSKVEKSENLSFLMQDCADLADVG